MDMDYAPDPAGSTSELGRDLQHTKPRGQLTIGSNNGKG